MEKILGTSEVSEISLGGITFEKIEAARELHFMGSERKEGRYAATVREYSRLYKSMITPAR